MAQNLTTVLTPPVRQLIENSIIKSMSVIDWGKAMARANEYIQKELLRFCGVEVYDPQLDQNCPNINTDNNSPGFDLIVKNKNGELKRVQSKLRQVTGKTDFSKQTHFETTRRNSKKNKDKATSESGHVAYSADEFDYVMVTLINVKNGTERRNDVNLWSFSIVPISDLVDPNKGCCLTHIPAKVLEKNKFTIQQNSPHPFN